MCDQCDFLSFYKLAYLCKKLTHSFYFMLFFDFSSKYVLAPCNRKIYFICVCVCLKNLSKCHLTRQKWLQGVSKLPLRFAFIIASMPLLGFAPFKFIRKFYVLQARIELISDYKKTSNYLLRNYLMALFHL
jgi:hypothetical protein